MSDFHKKLDSMITELQTALNDGDAIPCRAHRETSCLKEALKLGSRFWYGSDCKAAARLLCGTCLASWHVSVARNLILEDARFVHMPAIAAEGK